MVRLLLVALLVSIARVVPAAAPLVFCCEEGNDLYRTLAAARPDLPRYSKPGEALDRAPEGSGLLVLAEGYPAMRVQLDREFFDRAAGKRLRVYVEYPSFVPGIPLGEPKPAQWERLVISSDAWGRPLPKLRILGAHACQFLPAESADSLMSLARVAGFDAAVFGLPRQTYPILFTAHEGQWLIATTKLSNFITGRYAPARDWTAVWQFILSRMDPGRTYELRWQADVRPAYGSGDALPEDVESTACRRAAEWYLNSGLLVHATRVKEIHRLLAAGTESVPGQPADAPAGDGSLGILEGYASAILPDGSQPQRIPIRLDCNAESAMVLALEASRNDDLPRARTVAANLLDYVHFNAPSHRGPRGNSGHPAFGLISWGEVAPAWTVANYGDDNARAILATLAAAAALKTDRYDEPVLRALLANLRTTGSLGFRGDRLDIPQLERHGWKHFHDAKTVNYAPPFESYLWACYLWAYARTGEADFLSRTTNAIRMTMENYPKGWRWQDTMERARMLLCLAWLVRVEDTPQHRRWLDTIARDLLQSQQPSGALREKLGGAGAGHYVIPKSNEAYGTSETPLIQNSGDPATDQLYTTGFALLALHEAAAATDDDKLRKSEAALAAFLCRIQAHSPKRPDLNGAWFRAFNDRDWEYWASSADAGWGAWSVEAGWGQAWIAATLALRQKNISFWDSTSRSAIRRHLKAVKGQMLRNDGSPWKE